MFLGVNRSHSLVGIHKCNQYLLVHFSRHRRTQNFEEVITSDEDKCWSYQLEKPTVQPLLVRVPLAFVVFVATALVPIFAAPIEEKYILGWEILENPTRTSLAHAHWVLQLVASWIFDFNSLFPAYAVEPLDTCVGIASPWYGGISGFGPDPGVECFAYFQNNCNEAEWELVYPGDATSGLGTNNPWNDQSGKVCEFYV
ncbi:hypothetical protein B0H13DRAFT_1898433 [Mycena leptocephala]|nr:hypothetical protein B0H13DRAFT_1898433 [Mycena leptocephala]